MWSLREGGGLQCDRAASRAGMAAEQGANPCAMAQSARLTLYSIVSSSCSGYFPRLLGDWF